MKHKLRLYLIIISALVVVLGFLFFQYGSLFGVANRDQAKQKDNSKSKKGNRVIPVSVYLADYEVTDAGIPSIGTLLPYEEVMLASEMSGKVEKVNFEEGSKVRKGELLVKINDDDLQAQLKRTLAQQRQIKEKLARSKVLFDRNAVTKESLEQNEADFLMTEADIELIRVKINRTEIIAPFDGTIGFRNVALGSYLQPGSEIARLVDDSRLRLEFSIPEKYSNLIAKGSSIEFKTADQVELYKCTVYAIDPKIDIDTRTIVIRAIFMNTHRKLKAGMSASIRVGQKKGASIQIPTQSIVPENNNMKVWVVRNGKAHSTPVITGNRGDNLIEIKEGLVKGDSVITTGLLQIKEGSQLIINP